MAGWIKIRSAGDVMDDRKIEDWNDDAPEGTCPDGEKVKEESDYGNTNLELCTGKRTRTSTGMWCSGWTAARPPTLRTAG